MRLFFLKTYLAVIVFSIAMFFLIVFVIFKPVLLKSDWKDFNEELVVDHQLLMLELDKNPPEQWAKTIANYRPVFGMVLELIERQSLTPSELQALVGGGPRRYLSDFSMDVWYGLFTIPNSEQILKISEDGSPLNDITADNVIWIILPILLITLSQSFGIILIIRSISKPIKQLSTTALLFGQGDFKTRIENPKAPVKQLAQSFNTMAHQLEEKILELQLMIGAIPHELRTPLSRIRFALDLSRDKSSEKELRKQIEQIDAYVDNLDCAVEDVLELTRLKTGKTSLEDPIDLHEMIWSVIESYRDAHFEIVVDCAEGIVVTGNQGLIRRALHNLMQNAADFTTSHVSVRVFLDNEDIVINVDDDGPGIPTEKLNEVFLPFSRVDKSRSRETGGLGLGLAFVQLIMKQHHGIAAAINIDPMGLRVELRWPIEFGAGHKPF